ncbi:hypothetical protein QFZ43_000188 [Streptomyces afghaniensis]|nr:hypothetical protein [Streptomyces afghaniensis]
MSSPAGLAEMDALCRYLTVVPGPVPGAVHGPIPLDKPGPEAGARASSRLDATGTISPDQRLLRILLDDDQPAFEQALAARLLQHRQSAGAAPALCTFLPVRAIAVAALASPVHGWQLSVQFPYLPGSLPAHDMALLRWHLGESGEESQEPDEYPLLAARGPAQRIGGTLVGDLGLHGAGHSPSDRKCIPPNSNDCENSWNRSPRGPAPTEPSAICASLSKRPSRAGVTAAEGLWRRTLCCPGRDQHPWGSNPQEACARLVAMAARVPRARQLLITAAMGAGLWVPNSPTRGDAAAPKRNWLPPRRAEVAPGAARPRL